MSNQLPITIRPSASADADEIARLFLESAEYHAGLDAERYASVDAESVSARYSSGLQHPAHAVCVTLIAERHGEIVGFIDARLDRSPDPMHREMDYCSIAEIAVDKPYRNQGVGARLILAAEEWGRRQGAEFAVLEYHVANFVADCFYRWRLGYRAVSITAVKRLQYKSEATPSSTKAHTAE